jgi:hypothetical protein
MNLRAMRRPIRKQVCGRAALADAIARDNGLKDAADGAEWLRERG